jgi:hypothetical protein
MATLGTTTTTKLTAYTYSQSPNVLSYTNMATLKTGIKDDLNPASFAASQTGGNYTGSLSPNIFFDFNGLLMIPRRGLVKVFPGDVVAFDTQSGWPILVSAEAIAVGSSSWNYV